MPIHDRVRALTFSEHDKMIASHYDANYGNFQASLYQEIRREAFGEDIGQNSWLTADEQDKFLGWLGLGGGESLLDVACGAGGPTLRIAASIGCMVTGVDVHEQAISTARSLANQRGLENRANFRVVDANEPLPFLEASFGAILCIDAINHMSGRLSVLADWTRLLKPGGRLLFTDPIVVTGPLTREEIAIRSSAGFCLFVPCGYNEQIIEQCGLHLVASEDRTSNVADIAERRKNARASRGSDLRRIESDTVYERQQKFLAVAAQLARDTKLSRFVYVAEKA